jgi:hypothetical protein
MDLEEIFKCKTITPSSLNLYKTKLKILNDNKPIKNLNYLYNIDTIKSKIKELKPNTQRTYIIAITSILNCQTTQTKAPKKLKTLYQSYRQLLDEYNINLKDQTAITEGTKITTNENIDEIYNKLKENKDKNKQSLQDFTLLSLYHLIPPRRNRDYALLKSISKFTTELSKDYNYYDGYKLYFNNYKTRGKYNLQELDIPIELKTILNTYIKTNQIKNDELIFTNTRSNKPLTSSNAMTTILNRIFGDKIGSSALRRSYLSNKYSNARDELKDDVKAMGTSVDVANNNYIKKK